MNVRMCVRVCEWEYVSVSNILIYQDGWGGSWFGCGVCKDRWGCLVGWGGYQLYGVYIRLLGEGVGWFGWMSAWFGIT